MNLYTYYGDYLECLRLKYGDDSYGEGLLSLRREYVLAALHRSPRPPTDTNTRCGDAGFE